MEKICLHDKAKIEAFLRQHTFLNLYALGDLDKLFWNYTTWYALASEQQINQLVLLYARSIPVLLGLSEEVEELKELLRLLFPLLPKQFYAHLSGDAVSVFTKNYHIQSHGIHYKMALTDSSRIDNIDTSKVIPLSAINLDQLQHLYQASYPSNWFEPHMLESGYYYGIRRGGTLISVAGVHIYSQEYKVAALGNITTHPQWREQGLGTLVCAKLCQALLRTVEHIGLNVKADNKSAIACYKKLGFERIAAYEEFALELK